MKKMISFLLLAAVLTLSASCGQKNKVNSSQLGTGSVFSSGISYNSSSSSALSTYVSQYNCSSGTRHASAVFYLTTAYSYTTIGGNFTKGSLSGTAGTTYVGRSNYNDIMIVSKVLNSSGGMMGYNIELAFCVDSSNTYTPPYFANRGVTAFAAPYGITLVEPTTSSIGFIASKQSQALIEAYQNYYNQFILVTSFGY